MIVVVRASTWPYSEVLFQPRPEVMARFMAYHLAHDLTPYLAAPMPTTPRPTIYTHSAVTSRHGPRLCRKCPSIRDPL